MSLHMSRFLMIMIVGWTTTFAMFGFFAFMESGQLLAIRQRIASWLTSATPVVTSEGRLDPEGDEAA